MEDGGNTGRQRLSWVGSSSTGGSVGSMASVCLQRHRNAGGSRGPLPDSVGGMQWVLVAVPATQPAPLGEAVSAQRRPGAQVCWEKLAGCCGISAIRSSRDRLSFCQSHSEKRSWLSPSKVQALCLQPVELDAETLLARPASNSRE